MDHGCKWDLSSSNDTRIQSYIGHTKKQIIKLVIASHATNIVPREKCRYVQPQNGPTPHEHATQGLQFVMGVTQPIPFVHSCKRELHSHLNWLALCRMWSRSLGVNLTGISFACKYAITNAYS